MNYEKTKCTCCPNAISFADGHGLLTISNWRNFELTAMYRQDIVPSYSDDNKTVFKNTIYRLQIGVWMFRLSLTGNSLEPVKEGEEFAFNEKDSDLGEHGGLVYVPPSLEFGSIGFMFEFDYAGFSCDPDYETNIGISAALGLPFIGSAYIYYWWEPESRRVPPVPPAAQYMGPKATEQIAKYMLDPDQPK